MPVCFNNGYGIFMKINQIFCQLGFITSFFPDLFALLSKTNPCLASASMILRILVQSSIPELLKELVLFYKL